VRARGAHGALDVAAAAALWVARVEHLHDHVGQLDDAAELAVEGAARGVRVVGRRGDRRAGAAALAAGRRRAVVAASRRRVLVRAPRRRRAELAQLLLRVRRPRPRRLARARRAPRLPALLLLGEDALLLPRKLFRELLAERPLRGKARVGADGGGLGAAGGSRLGGLLAGLLALLAVVLADLLDDLWL